jgi:hypothetical protein
MKAKLIKKDEHYFLEVEPYTLSTLQRHTLIANTFDKPKGHILQLSIKNCEAIEHGYDLDELARDGVKFHEQDEIHRPNSEHLYKKGFQKAIELMGDKKFSEDYLKRMCSISFNFYKRNDLSDSELEEEWENWLKNTIQSSQQPKEIEVEIEMECLDPNCDGIDKKGVCIPGDKPKLDSQGCLILKHVV